MFLNRAEAGEFLRIAVEALGRYRLRTSLSVLGVVLGVAAVIAVVSVGEGALIGIGAVAIPGISIGARSVVGAGAAVTRDLPPDCVAVGVPARVIKIKEKDG